jgi:SNF2 family DNA or RNA helicase
MISLYKHQKDALKATESKNRVAYYHDMGLGKTYTGGEKLMRLGAKVNLVICQKSKIDDWIEHFKYNYCEFYIYDLTNKDEFDDFITIGSFKNVAGYHIGVINYDLVWRRPELKRLHDFTLLLDESSLIQNETAKRTKFIMKLDYANLILLSGTPTGGKYEKLYSQLKMLGYNMTKKSFYNMYVNFHYDTRQGFPLMIIDGYKNVERLKKKMREYGCNFLKTEEVLDLPDQNFIPVKVKNTPEYKKFMRNRVVSINLYEPVPCGEYGDYESDTIQLVGDTSLTKLLYARILCGAYNEEKLKAFTDLAESTNDRLIVFYNFNVELEALISVCNALERPYSLVNGERKDLYNYEHENASITLIQYQAGAMGLNLQKANKIIYFTPPLSSELYEQSKKRIHRIGQQSSCFYYNLTCTGSVEEKIYKTLEMRKDYTEALFERGE